VQVAAAPQVAGAAVHTPVGCVAGQAGQAVQAQTGVIPGRQSQTVSPVAVV